VTTLEFRDRLARRTRRARAPISLSVLDPLESYFRLLAHWNSKINLTSLPLDPPTDETFDRLFVEPLGASKHLPNQMSGVWLDLGSGGGSPAIPLKIVRPRLRLTMIESKERKSAFLREAIRTLGLTDAAVLTERFEDTASVLEHSESVDIVTVRAVRPDACLFEAIARLLREDGQLFLFRPAHAASADPPGFRRVNTFPLIESPQSFLTIYARKLNG
jgi:16S rRNA (guanine527-N7)-methyltransferase